jgi:hypothetical protein
MADEISENEFDIRNVRRGTSVPLSSSQDVTLYEYLEARVSGQRAYFDVQIECLKNTHVASIKTLDAKLDQFVVTYKDGLIQQKELTQLRFDASQQAILKAEVATDKRFESVNQFRDQLVVQAGSFATKEALEGWVRESRAAHESLGLEIAKSADTLNKQLSDYISRVTNQFSESSVRAVQAASDQAARAEELNSSLSNRLSNLEGRMVAYVGFVGVGVTLISAIFSYFAHLTAVATK